MVVEHPIATNPVTRNEEQCCGVYTGGQYDLQLPNLYNKRLYELRTKFYLVYKSQYKIKNYTTDTPKQSLIGNEVK